MTEQEVSQSEKDHASALTADDQPWDALREFQTSEGEPGLRFGRRVPAKTMLLLAYVLIGMALPLAGVYLLINPDGDSVDLVIRGAFLLVGLLVSLHLWRNHRACLAVNLDPTGVVVEFRFGVRALRWDEVERVRDSLLHARTTISGEQGTVTLPWQMERSEAMVAYAAEQLRQHGAYRAEQALSRSGVHVTPKGLETKSFWRKILTEWSRVRVIRLHMPEETINASVFQASRPNFNTTFNVIVEADGEILRLSGGESNLTLYAVLVDAWEAWKAEQARQSES